MENPFSSYAVFNDMLTGPAHLATQTEGFELRYQEGRLPNHNYLVPPLNPDASRQTPTERFTTRRNTSLVTFQSPIAPEQ